MKATISFVDNEMSAMLGFIPNCVGTLKHLRVDSGIYQDFQCSFDCALIKDCKELTYLDLDIDNHEWNWFTTVRDESKIENLHLLPTSIRELRIEGYLPVSKTNDIFGNLKKLQKFVSTGYGRCGRNIALLTSVLKDSNISVFVLENDRLE